MSDSDITGYMDTPEVLDASVTPIPGSGSSPLQVVSAMAIGCSKVSFYDGVGQYIGIYKGAAGSETLVCIIGGGGSNQSPCMISFNQRVSVRSMEAASITSGSLCLQFLR